MAGRRTNLGLLAALGAAFATGAGAYGVGTGWNRWLTVLHGVGGFALLLLVPWKSVIVRRGMRRRRPRWALSTAFGALLAVAVAAGFLHTAGQRGLGPVTAMQVHVGAAVFALPLLAWHVVARPARPRRTDLSRRSLLRTTAVAAGAGAAYLATEGLWWASSLPGRDRRFTGSHEVGSFDPAAMPVTQWFRDSVPRVDAEAWALEVEAGGETARFGYDELDDPAEPRDRFVATLDCTGGWFARQEWEGLLVHRLLPEGAAGESLVVRSVTGYERRFPLGDTGHLLLATRVGGAPLGAGHGFPARLVAPGRRGFWWVKWLSELRVSDEPWWWQPPFPLR